MSFNYPFAIPTLIPADTNFRTTRVSTLYPTEILGPYDSWKLPVLVATTTNITLSGLQTIDGITVAEGDRVLVKNQVTASQNGIYTVFSSASATDGWLRSNDLPNGSNAANMAVFVNEGTINADIMFICTNDPGSDRVGTNNLVYISYGDVSSIVPGGNNSNVQYNSGGTFAGSDIFTFDPSFYMSSIGYPTRGTVTIGSLSSVVPLSVGLITSPNAATSSGLSGTPLMIRSGSGDGVGNGEGIILIAGFAGASGTNGGGVYINGGDGINGGDVVLVGGSGTTNSGNIRIIADSTGTQKGYIKLTTDTIDTYWRNGGVQFTKDVSMSIADLTAPPTIATAYRQGIITIVDPSALVNGTSITITVNNINVLVDDTVYVCVQNFNTGGTGIPMVLVSSVTTSTSFTVQLYNIGAAAFSASEMKISFILF